MRRNALIALALLFVPISTLLAQVDSVIFRNRNYIVGEVKSMDRGILTMETDYSDDDFTIEWEGIAEIYTVTSFLITLSDGNRYNGTLKMGPDGVLLLETEENGEVAADIGDVVYLTSVDNDFWSRLYASIDFGFSFAKANHYKQTSLRLNLGYIANRWNGDVLVNNVYSNQDDVDPTRRNEAVLTFRYYLPHDWFGLVQLNFLSNTEQLLDLRSNGKVGIGKYLTHTNAIYWAAQGGVAYNNENFSSDAPDRNSMEAFLGTEYNMYDVGDLNLLTKLIVYPSITEKGRWRIDYNFDAKYDLPLDFYIGAGFSLNFDNQPVEGAGKTDYVITTSVGWEW